MNLSNISYDEDCFTIIFIIVGHNGEVFSFLNNTNKRHEFFWDRWSEWRHLLTPYSVHAFFVKSYNTKSDSGMGFKAVEHLCEFINLKEGQIFNAEYLKQYQKAYEEASAQDATDLATEFASRLISIQDERSQWLELAALVAMKSFSNKEISEMFPNAGQIYGLSGEFDLSTMIDAQDFMDFFNTEVE